MRDLAGFRAAVRERCRAAGRTQQQLARAVGLHPDVLSHKLHQRGALLNAADVVAVVTALADWGTVGSAAEARGLLALMGVPERAIPAQAWTTGPLSALPSGPPSAVPDPGAAAAVPGEGAAAAGPGAGAVATAAGGRLAPVPLPVPLTPLVGRASEVTAVTAAVPGCRLLTLTGTGGTGKTRVALAAAAGLAGWWIFR